MWSGAWNKRKLISEISNRFLASSVGRAENWWSGGYGFKPHYGQFLVKFILCCVTSDLSDNLTEMRQNGLSWKKNHYHSIPEINFWCKINTHKPSAIVTVIVWILLPLQDQWFFTIRNNYGAWLHLWHFGLVSQSPTSFCFRSGTSIFVNNFTAISSVSRYI